MEQLYWLRWWSCESFSEFESYCVFFVRNAQNEVEKLSVCPFVSAKNYLKNFHGIWYWRSTMKVVGQT